MSIKKTRKQYGKLPVKLAEATPREIVQVNLVALQQYIQKHCGHKYMK
jgi:hypothetical protein